MVAVTEMDSAGGFSNCPKELELTISGDAEGEGFPVPGRLLLPAPRAGSGVLGDSLIEDLRRLMNVVVVVGEFMTGLFGRLESCSRALMRCEIPEETPSFLGKIAGEDCGWADCE